MAKPTLPQGTRDFSPETVRKRNYIFSIIKNVFELYGFQPLETPAMENLETLLGKYGDEGDKLIFRILNNGLNDPKNTEKSRTAFENVMQGKNDKNLTERALRYDLTIPFARFVAMNHGQLVYPFKRYQVQPVWRADRPQKGRYREFYQCDADVVGSESLLNELDFINIYHDVFSRLKMQGYELRVNSRKVLTALAAKISAPEKLTAITVIIDKLDKIGLDKVKEELAATGLSAPQLNILGDYLAIDNRQENNEINLERIKAITGDTDEGKIGITELEFILKNISGEIPLKLDFTLVRGLNYYTGIIFEVTAPPHIKMGSIGGGGRYDDLTGLFGVPGIPGAGISFGVDRIYDVLEEMNLFPAEIEISTRILFINEGGDTTPVASSLARRLRKKGISCEIYPDFVKDDKQYKYAKKKNIPFIAFIRRPGHEIFLKNIQTGESILLSDEQLLAHPFSDS